MAMERSHSRGRRPRSPSPAPYTTSYASAFKGTQKIGDTNSSSSSASSSYLSGGVAAALRGPDRSSTGRSGLSGSKTPTSSHSIVPSSITQSNSGAKTIDVAAIPRSVLKRSNSGGGLTTGSSSLSGPSSTSLVSTVANNPRRLAPLSAAGSSNDIKTAWAQPSGYLPQQTTPSQQSVSAQAHAISMATTAAANATAAVNAQSEALQSQIMTLQNSLMQMQTRLQGETDARQHLERELERVNRGVATLTMSSAQTNATEHSLREALQQETARTNELRAQYVALQGEMAQLHLWQRRAEATQEQHRKELTEHSQRQSYALQSALNQLKAAGEQEGQMNSKIMRLTQDLSRMEFKLGDLADLSQQKDKEQQREDRAIEELRRQVDRLALAQQKVGLVEETKAKVSSKGEGWIQQFMTDYEKHQESYITARMEELRGSVQRQLGDREVVEQKRIAEILRSLTQLKDIVHGEVSARSTDSAELRARMTKEFQSLAERQLQHVTEYDQQIKRLEHMTRESFSGMFKNVKKVNDDMLSQSRNTQAQVLAMEEVLRAEIRVRTQKDQDHENKWTKEESKYKQERRAVESRVRSIHQSLSSQLKSLTKHLASTIRTQHTHSEDIKTLQDLAKQLEKRANLGVDEDSSLEVTELMTWLVDQVESEDQYRMLQELSQTAAEHKEALELMRDIDSELEVQTCLENMLSLVAEQHTEEARLSELQDQQNLHQETANIIKRQDEIASELEQLRQKAQQEQDEAAVASVLNGVVAQVVFMSDSESQASSQREVSDAISQVQKTIDATVTQMDDKINDRVTSVEVSVVLSELVNAIVLEESSQQHQQEAVVAMGKMNSSLQEVEGRLEKATATSAEALAAQLETRQKQADERNAETANRLTTIECEIIVRNMINSVTSSEHEKQLSTLGQQTKTQQDMLTALQKQGASQAEALGAASATLQKMQSSVDEFGFDRVTTRLKDMDAMLKQTDSHVKQQAKSIEVTNETMKTSVLGSLGAVTNKVTELEGRLNKTDSTIEAMSKEVKENADGISSLELTVEQQETVLTSTRSALEAVDKKTEEQAAATKEIDERLEQTTKAITEAVTSLQERQNLVETQQVHPLHRKTMERRTSSTSKLGTAQKAKVVNAPPGSSAAVAAAARGAAATTAAAVGKTKEPTSPLEEVASASESGKSAKSSETPRKNVARSGSTASVASASAAAESARASASAAAEMIKSASRPSVSAATASKAPSRSSSKATLPKSSSKSNAASPAGPASKSGTPRGEPKGEATAKTSSVKPAQADDEAEEDSSAEATEEVTERAANTTKKAEPKPATRKSASKSSIAPGTPRKKGASRTASSSSITPAKPPTRSPSASSVASSAKPVEEKTQQEDSAAGTKPSAALKPNMERSPSSEAKAESSAAVARPSAPKSGSMASIAESDSAQRDAPANMPKSESTALARKSASSASIASERGGTSGQSSAAIAKSRSKPSVKDLLAASASATSITPRTAVKSGSSASMKASQAIRRTPSKGSMERMQTPREETPPERPVGTKENMSRASNDASRSPSRDDTADSADV